MSHCRSVRFGRVFSLALEPGDDILACAREAVFREKVADAVFLAGAGAVDGCRSHFAAKNEEGEYRDYPLSWSGPYSICAVQGFIERGQVHLHGVIGDKEGSWTVHIHEGCTCLGSFRLVFAELLGPKAP